MTEPKFTVEERVTKMLDPQDFTHAKAVNLVMDAIVKEAGVRDDFIPLSFRHAIARRVVMQLGNLLVGRYAGTTDQPPVPEGTTPERVWAEQTFKIRREDVEDSPSALQNYLATVEQQRRESFLQERAGNWPVDEPEADEGVAVNGQS
jgi:hypothetical protein